MQLNSQKTFTALGDNAFVSLTTFRKTGERVSTPVWVVRDGDALIVTTPKESGKVKRLHNSGRVEIRPCSRMGNVAAGNEPVPGIAEIITDEATTARLTSMIQKKYGVEYHTTMLIERIMARRQQSRVILRITSVALNA